MDQPNSREGESQTFAAEVFDLKNMRFDIKEYHPRLQDEKAKQRRHSPLTTVVISDSWQFDLSFSDCLKHV